MVSKLQSRGLVKPLYCQRNPQITIPYKKWKFINSNTRKIFIYHFILHKDLQQWRFSFWRWILFCLVLELRLIISLTVWTRQIFISSSFNYMVQNLFSQQYLNKKPKPQVIQKKIKSTPVQNDGKRPPVYKNTFRRLQHGCQCLDA